MARIEELRKALRWTKTRMAGVMGITSPHYAQIITGRNKVSATHLERIYKNKDAGVRPEWLLKGEGDMFLINDDKSLPDSVIGEADNYEQKEPTQEDIDRLYSYVLERRGVQLNPLQDIKFRMACYKSIKENPQLEDLRDWAIAASIYLNFILRNPGIEI